MSRPAFDAQEGDLMSQRSPKLVQICASQNDLFGLDDDGHVYQYNFKSNSWMHLGQGRSVQAESSLADGQALPAQASSGTSVSRYRV
jgi:hypothetical protein